MKTLAQIILDTAEKVNDGELTRHFNNSHIPLDEMPMCAHALKNSMCYTLDHNVTKAIENLAKSPAQNLLNAFPFAKLPHEKVWIEMQRKQKKDTKQGFYLLQNGEDIIVNLVMAHAQYNFTPMYYRRENCFTIDKDGIFYNGPKKEHPLEKNVDELATVYRIVVSLLLLINSRSDILKVSEPSKLQKQFSKKREKKNGSTKILHHKISFDIARILEKNPNLSANEAKSQMAAALVRGHFKVRKTGVFFWSPYVRGAKTPEQKEEARQSALQKERSVTQTSPHVGLPKPRP